MSANETNNLQKSELLKKLEKISSLYNKTLLIRNEMDYFTPEDNYERKVVVPIFPGENTNTYLKSSVVHEETWAIEKMEEKYDSAYRPQEPKKPRVSECPNFYNGEEAEITKKYGYRRLICLIAGIISLLTMFFDGGGLLYLVIAGVCGYFFFNIHKKISKAKENDAVKLQEMQKEYNEEVKKKTKQYEEALENYENKLASHNKEKEKFLSEYKDWREIYIQHLEEEAEIEKKLEIDTDAAVAKIYEEKYLPAVEELTSNNDLVAKEYLHVLDTIINLLKTGRADTLKEAINLHEEILYKERKLQLQIEIEEQRQYEEELRREDEERRYQEQMDFQREKELNRKHEAEQQLKLTEKHHKEQMTMLESQAHEEKLRYEKDRQNQKRCVFCAHASTCRQRYYDGAYNCTGFTPKQ
ncbi:MAG: hypothetical protein IJA43_01925 [Clostridia bacterium]|nr:hypothetical protein [Clostridia bacterium]